MQLTNKVLLTALLLIVFAGLGQAQLEYEQFMAMTVDQNPQIRAEAVALLEAEKVSEQQVIDRLVELLADSDYSVQQVASAALVKVGSAAVPSLESGLTKYSHASMLPVRQAIARILGQIDTAESVTVLMQMLNDPAPQIRRAAAQGLEAIGPAARHTSRKLGELILDRNEDAQVRAAAAQAIGKIGYDNDLAVLALAVARVESAFQLVWAAQGALNNLQIDTEVMVTALLRLLDDAKLGFLANDALIHIINTSKDGISVVKNIFLSADTDVKQLLAVHLGAFAVGVDEASQSEMLELFLLALNDENAQVRLSACLGVTALDSAYAGIVPRLAELAEDHEESIELRRAAVNAWEWLVKNDYQLEEQIIAHALDSSEDRQIRESAYRMIGLMDKVSSQLALKLLAALDQIDSDCRWAVSPYLFAAAKQDSEVLKALINTAIDHSDSEIKLYAVRILSAVGPGADQAIPILMDMVLNAHESSLRIAAARALSEIGAGRSDLNDIFTLLTADSNPNVSRIAKQYLGVSQLSEPPIVPAFPTAEGFGAWTQGGRGGRVFIVTNLNDRGPGSLREAIDASGPRIVVFAVSGVIRLQSPLLITNPYLTIAGQTAPGQGITIADYDTRIQTHDVIIQHLRFRLGDLHQQEADTLWINESKNIILDHVSTSWGVDETLSVSASDNITVQWSLITESLKNTFHSKGAHGYGSLIRGEFGSKYSFLNNLWAHHMGRMPRPGNYTDYRRDPEGALIDFRNNVFYNWGGTTSGANNDNNSVTKYNFINNYYISGFNSGGSLAFREYSPYAQAYFAGNYMNGDVPTDPWSLVDVRISRDVFETSYRQSQPFDTGLVTTVSALEAYERVMADGGALPRDLIDQRVVQSVIERTGRHIDSPQDVGGLQRVFSHPAAKDSNYDGIPDWWCIRYGFDPSWDLPLNEDFDGDGYTNIEEYLHGTDPEVYVDYTKGKGYQ
ncbi:MAG TPA: hypothetical protein GX019_01800 [Firmicutes bacterium]|nr:hypothetical protein [Bacillota bacterium]